MVVKTIPYCLMRIIVTTILFFVVPLVVAATPKDALVIAWRIDDIITLDPAAMFESSALEYAYNSYDRLIGYNSKLPHKFYGVVAQDWSISPDGKVYTFTIRDNLKFATGNNITAEDVVFSLRRAILLNKAASSILSQFGFTPENIVANIAVIAPNKVQLKLTHSFASNLVLNCLTAPVASIVDKKEVLAHQDQDDLGNKWLSTHHAGSGPFKLNKWVANEVLSLEKNQYSAITTEIKQVIIRHVSEASTQKLLLEQNDVDVARNLQASNFEKLSQQIKLVRTIKNDLICLSLNQNNPYLQHPAVRQAIKYLIDYKAIQDTILKDTVQVHQSFIPSGFFAVNDDNPYSFDLAKARALLKTAGLENGFAISLDAKDILLAQAIQAALAKANIKISIIPGDSKQVLTKFRERKYDAMLTTWSADYRDPHANAVSFTNNPDNSIAASDKTLAWRASWDIPELNKLTIQAARELDLKKRASTYTMLQQQFLMHSPIIVLFQEVEAYAINNKAVNFNIKFDVDTSSLRYAGKND